MNNKYKTFLIFAALNFIGAILNFLVSKIHNGICFALWAILCLVLSLVSYIKSKKDNKKD